MKIMNKLAGKISALLLGSAMFATTLGLGIAALPEKGVKATAATTAETIGGVTVRNVEDVITSKEIGNSSGVSFSIYNRAGFGDMKAWNTPAFGNNGKTIQGVAYDRLPQEGEFGNANTYEGNISIPWTKF